ncbi:glycine-rich domain-containing protein [Micromonospora matsumotoense]|uniref:glycine-rich domain-containing protein n=1 Tax=Micromonospora matsumotoense TaxID=121616 RepID=UPI0033DA2703
MRERHGPGQPGLDTNGRSAMLLTSTSRAGRELVSDELFTRLARRIAHDHPELSPDLPARIADQALAFLGACAVTTESIGPSEMVDIGWHTFILHTRDYADFCERTAGRFIHHEPEPTSDDPPPSSPEPIGAPISRTVSAIVAAGFTLDHPLWVGVAAECTQCHAGCTDSPTR